MRLRYCLIISAVFMFLTVVSGVSFAQYTGDTATTLAANGSSSASMDADHTETWWAITIPSDGKLYVKTVSQATIEIDLYLYEKTDGAYRNIKGYDIGSGVNESTTFDNLMAGTYYVKAYRYSGAGSYTITSTFTSASLDNDVADNDAADKAVSLGINSSDTGHLGFYGQTVTDIEDWWKVTVPSDGKLYITTHSDATAELDLYLYELIGGSYVNIKGYDIGYGVDESVTYVNITPGTYYLRVYRYGGYGCYTITSSFTPALLDNDVAGNDSAETAVSLGVNGSDTGHLGYYGQTLTDIEDWWKVTVPTDGKLYVTTQSETTMELDLYLYEYNSGSYVNIRGYDIGTGVDESLTYVNLAPGTYYIKVYRYAGYGSYTITSSLTPARLENDATGNDTAETAVSLGYNASDTGHVGFYSAGYTDVEDYWAITTPADGKLYVTTQSDSTTEIDLYLYAYINGSYINIRGYDIGSGVNESLTFVNLMPGTYYLRVYRYAGYGSYSITSSFTPAKYQADTEPDDTRETAVAIAVQTGITGHLGFYSTEKTDVHDWFSFNVPASWDSLFVRAVSDPLMEMDMYMYNSNGNNIASDGRGGVDSVIYMKAPEAGTYYVDFYRYAGYGPYSFIVTNTWRTDVPVTETPDTSTGMIAGAITSSSNGAAVPYATVTIYPGALTGTTNGSGGFSVSGLAPGTYSIAVSANSYESKMVSAVTVAGGLTTTVNVSLNPVQAGPVTTNVTAIPAPTAGAEYLTVNALVTAGSASKIAPFETAFKTERLVIANKTGQSKAAKISSLTVGNAIVTASVDESSGEFYIETADGKSLLYNDFYTGRAIVRVDGTSYLFGSSDGTWITPPTYSSNTVTGTWRITNVSDIRVTMSLSIVQSTTTGNYDTYKISYDIRNTGSTAHSVGFYKMLDTNLNQNDDAPVSAGDGYNRNERSFSDSSVPNFWQAYEDGPTQTSDKLVAQGTLYGGGAVKPDRLALGSWWNLREVQWDYTPAGTYDDSAVGMWWNPVSISAGGSRTVTTLYGLGAVESVTGDIALSVSSESQLTAENGTLVPNPFQVSALVTNTSGSTLSNVELLIELPAGLSLAGGETAVKSLGTMTNGLSMQAQWLVLATEKNTEELYSYAVTVTTSTSGINSNSVPKTVLVPAVSVESLTVTAAEMFVDSDPGAGNGVSMSSSDGAFDESQEAVTGTLAISNLGLGTHMVYVRGRDSNGVWGPATSYIIEKTTGAGELAPPTNVKVVDTANDNGHSLTLTWTLSADNSIVSEYRIFRSRNSAATTPVPIDSYGTIDALKAAELTTTIHIATVSAGTATYIDNAVPVNNVNYYYWVQAVSATGASKLAAAEAAVLVAEEPRAFSVSAPYPNPFNPSTSIRFEIPEASHVRLVIYDSLGREVAMLEDRMMEAGVHETVWNARNAQGEPVASGLYLFRIDAGANRAGGKMLYLR